MKSARSGMIHESGLLQSIRIRSKENSDLDETLQTNGVVNREERKWRSIGV
jgi:hypothetical protein